MMSEEKHAELIYGLIKALEENDIEKALSFCTDDVTFVSPVGTFSGKEKVRDFFKWMIDTIQEIKFTKTGIEILVQGDKAVDEHIVTGKHDGEEVEISSICTYQFSNGKIKKMRDAYDRLTLVNQAVKGWLPKKIVGAIIQQSRKGLD